MYWECIFVNKKKKQDRCAQGNKNQDFLKAKLHKTKTATWVAAARKFTIVERLFLYKLFNGCFSIFILNIQKVDTAFNT